MFAYIWEYTVNEDCIDEVCRIYSPDGDWVQLFRKSKGFVRTELFREVNTPIRFVTTDYWESKEYRDRFRLDFKDEFSKLDDHCDSLTIEERLIGDFEIQD